MGELRFKKGISEAMSRDILAARRRILRRAEPEETWELMRLSDDLQGVGRADHLAALADRFEAGAHHLDEHFEIRDAEATQEVANKMAADLRRLQSYESELIGEPITEQRLRHAEDLCKKYGVALNLLNRTAGASERFLN